MLIFAKAYPHGTAAEYLSFLSVWIIPTFWVAIPPVTELFLAFAYVKKSDETGEWYHPMGDFITPFGAFHIINICILIIPFFLWILFIGISTFVATYSHPHNNDPFAHFPWNFEVYYTLLRLVLSIIVVFFNSIEWLTVIIGCISILFFISYIWYSCPYYDPTISWVFSACILSVAFLSFFSFDTYICYEFLGLTFRGYDFMNLMIIILCIFITY